MYVLILHVIHILKQKTENLVAKIWKYKYILDQYVVPSKWLEGQV